MGILGGFAVSSGANIKAAVCLCFKEPLNNLRVLDSIILQLQKQGQEWSK